MIVTWPDYPVSSIRWKKTNRVATFASGFGSQSIELSMPVWTVEMSGLPEERAFARKIGVLIDMLDGYKNQLALWNVEHPTPDGTMRGTMALYSDASQGATSLSIMASGQGYKTLLSGDFIGIGSGTTQQVLQIANDAQADQWGMINVQTTTPIRNTFIAGESVAWDKPCALFRQSELSDGIEFTPSAGSAWSLSLVEDWRP